MSKKQPLNGMVVLDFTRVLAGPYATMILGDLGAEIIKIEPPGGDESRSWPPALKNGQSGYFMALNRNKKSMALNLKNPESTKIVHSLARQSNVIVENYAPGVAKKLGIDYESLCDENSQLIYCSISGFGQDGPYRDKRAYDPIIQGMTGLMSITGEKDGPPCKVGIPITDLVAAIYAVIAIQAAYINLVDIKQGQYIDIALYDSMISLLTVMGMEYFATGKSPKRMGLDHVHRVPARAFETKDGKYVQVAATSDKMFRKYCNAIGEGFLADDKRFSNNTKRVNNREIITPILENAMRKKTLQDWMCIFESEGIPCGPIMDMEEVFREPIIEERNLVFDIEHPTEGHIKQFNSPFKFSNIAESNRCKPPNMGEHTNEILSEKLGMKQKDIEVLKEQGVFDEQ